MLKSANVACFNKFEIIIFLGGEENIFWENAPPPHGATTADKQLLYLVLY